MTGEGTNQYLLGERRLTLIDAALGAGPNLDRLQAELSSLNGRVEQILLTHIHPDHLGGAMELRSEFGSTACKAIHVCQSCKRPFEEFKAI